MYKENQFEQCEQPPQNIEKYMYTHMYVKCVCNNLRFLIILHLLKMR